MSYSRIKLLYPLVIIEWVKDPKFEYSSDPSNIEDKKVMVSSILSNDSRPTSIAWESIVWTIQYILWFLICYKLLALHSSSRCLCPGERVSAGVRRDTTGTNYKSLIYNSKPFQRPFYLEFLVIIYAQARTRLNIPHCFIEQAGLCNIFVVRTDSRSEEAEPHEGRGFERNGTQGLAWCSKTGGVCVSIDPKPMGERKRGVPVVIVGRFAARV